MRFGIEEGLASQCFCAEDNTENISFSTSATAPEQDAESDLACELKALEELRIFVLNKIFFA